MAEAVEKIRAFNRPVVLMAFMGMVVALVYLNVETETLFQVTSAVGPLVGFYVGIKGEKG